MPSFPFSEREKSRVSEYQKWDYITLSDFEARSCTPILSYGWLIFLAIISVAVYGADTFTCVNLLVFDKWSSQINPSIPFRISRWIFAACILFSWVLLAYEWLRAIRVIRRGNVAESYLDPLAVTLESVRVGHNGRGWRRFLVFAELTKSRKGADYVALFCYFQFKGAIRILLAEGPRQAVNALTLYSVMQANLIPTGDHAASDGHSQFVQFFVNVKILAGQHTEQAVILFTMLFTFIIWVVSALSLLISCLMYFGFLWHYIPSADGSLSRYCRRKIDKRLEKIVNVKFRRAVKMQDTRRRREDGNLETDKGEDFGHFTRKPTLPILPEKGPDYTVLGLPASRVAALPAPPPSAFRPAQQERVPTQPQAPTNVEMGFAKPGYPVRTGTQSSGYSQHSSSSFDSNGPLMSQAATMGTSVSQRDQRELGSLPQVPHNMGVYDHDLDRIESGLAQMPLDPSRVPPIRTMRNAAAETNLARKPLPPYTVPGAWQGSTDKPTPPLPLSISRKSDEDQIFPPQYPHSQPAPPPAVRFGSATYMPLPSRNFSLPDRRQPPAPVFASQPPSPITARHALPPRQPAGPGPIDRSPPHQPPPSAYRLYTANAPVPSSSSPHVQRIHTFDVSTKTSIPLLQTPRPPRRNATLPTTLAPQPDMRSFAPPRRVETEPLPYRYRGWAGEEEEKEEDGNGRWQTSGRRGPLPDRVDDAAAGAYAKRTTYRFL